MSNQSKASRFIPTRETVTSAELITDAEWKLMSKAMIKANGVGIAAPQIGIMKQACIVAPKGKERLYMLAPYIIESGKSVKRQEACLSLPGKSYEVERAKSVLVSWVHGKTGVHETRLFGGEVAQIIQHEVDHLNGIMIDDRGVEQ